MFDICYKSRNSVKGLADFVSEFTPPLSSLVGLRSMSDRGQWKVLVDGASNAKGSRVGIVMISP